MYLGRRLPLALLVVAAASLVVPLSPWALLAAGIAVVIALAAVDVVMAPSAAALGMQRFAPAVLRLGRPASVRLTLRNPTSRPLEIAVHDAALPSLGRSPRRHTARLEAKGRAELVADLLPQRRGRFTLGPVTVRTSGPLGLGGRQRTVPALDVVKVYPSLHGREEVELRLRRSRLEPGMRQALVRGGGSTFDTLREYQPDDEFRRINWRATARSSKAIANQYREERNQQVLVLLDASRSMAAQVEGVARLEHALDAAVAVADLSTRVGDHVGVVAFGAEVRAQLDARGSRDQPHRIVDLLFGLQASLDAPNYARAFTAVLQRQRRRALLLLFTDLAERSVIEPLVAAIRVLRARHIVIVAAVRDPAVEAMATARPTTSEEAYDKAAAASLLAWRDAAADVLRSNGVATFDLHPGELAGRIADEYLRLKSLGRL